MLLYKSINFGSLFGIYFIYTWVAKFRVSYFWVLNHIPFGVDFTNILLAAFMCADHKSARKRVGSTVSFALL